MNVSNEKRAFPSLGAWDLVGLFGILVLLSLLVTGCGKLGGGGSSSQIDQSAPVTASYSSIAATLLAPGCVSCHGGSGGYSFDSYSATMRAVVAGNPSASALYTTMASGRMPQSGTGPSATQLQAVYNWIRAGAPNN